MKLTIMGSAAAEAVPALWCECEVCRKAWKNMGKDVRMRTSYLLDSDTLIDYGPDIFQQSLRFRLDWPAIRRVLITHAHEDHLDPAELLWRQPGFAQISRAINFYGGADVMEKTAVVTGLLFEKLQLNRIIVKPYTEVIDADLSIFALPAQHGTENPLNYILRRDGKTVLIANDTGWWPQANWDYIRAFNFDVAIIECTMGINPRSIDSRVGHLGAHSSVEFRNKLVELGTITTVTTVGVNHFSHNGNSLHQSLCEYFNPHNIIVCYDGLEINL